MGVKTATHQFRFLFSIGSLFLLASIIYLNLVANAFASYQNCNPNSTCTIGEFIYDDDYAPLTGAACTLNSKDPNGVDLFVNQALTGQSDGWYEYSFSTNSYTTGLYRTQLCCVVTGETMCLDKSFTISDSQSTSPDSIATAVWDAQTSDHDQAGSFGLNLQNAPPTVTQIWGYTNRTLSSYTDLIDNIWSHSTRSLTSFGSLIVDLWNNGNRSLTSATLDSGSLSTSQDVTTAVTSIKGADNKDLSEISQELSLISASLLTIDAKITALDTKTNTLLTSTSDILSKWDTYSIVDLISILNTIDANLGTSSDTCTNNDTVFGTVQCVRDKWGAQSASQIYLAANSAAATSDLIRSELGFSGKSSTAYDEFVSLKSYVDTLETSIGSQGDDLNQATLFGRMALVRKEIDNLMITDQDIDILLDRWGEYDIQDVLDKITLIVTQVSSSNSVAGVDEILSLTKTISKDQQETNTNLLNKLLALEALTEVNRVLLEQAVNQPIIKVWLENGSVVFKILITNPSNVSAQTVPVKYYLPKEVSPEDIISVGNDLTAEYDPLEAKMVIQGEFVLPAKASRLFEVELADIWVVTDQEMNSIKSQADTLFKPLESTSYFAQASILYNDIKAHLDKIVLYQQEAITPEARIMAFRQGRVELEAAESKLSDLKSLVSVSAAAQEPEATNPSLNLGLIGLIITGVLAALSIFGLLISLHLQTKKPKPKASQLTAADKPTKTLTLNFSKQKPKTEPGFKYKPAVVFLSVATITALTTSLGALYLLPKNQTSTPETQEESPHLDLATETQTNVEESNLVNEGPLVEVLDTGLGYLNVRSEPKVGSQLISRVKVGDKLPLLDKDINESGDAWIKIQLEDESSGWVIARLMASASGSLSIPQADTSAASPSETVLGTSTTLSKGVIRVPSEYPNVKVRLEPKEESLVLFRFWVEHQVEVVETIPGWTKIVISDQSYQDKDHPEGWVKSEFVDEF